ncbi:MAG: 1-phosphofructokinase family hexose kinase, partial [Rhodobacterales bacterium]
STTGKQFRFMLPGPVWGEAERARVFTLLRATARPGGLSVISGSQPPGVPVDFPAQLAASMPESRVVLDTSGSTLTEAVRHPIPGLEVLRMDGEEGEALAGRPLPALEDTASFAQSLVHAGVARMVIIARGAEGNVLADAQHRIFAKAAKVKVKSTVGAGDSFVAAFVLALSRGQSNDEALALGSAAASAAVMSDATQLCRPEDVQRLLPQCAVSRV